MRPFACFTKKTAVLSALATLACSAPAFAAQFTFDLDHCSVGFSVRHLMVSTVRGRFGKFKGTLDYDPANIKNSATNVSIDVASIDTGSPKRDKHLRSKDFFDAAKIPTITFVSKEITDISGNHAKIKGVLTMHGVSKDVVLDTDFGGMAKDPWGNNHAAFSAHTKIKRSDFGMTWNQALEAGGVLVSDDVDIDLEIEAIEKK